jgi:hypothetical protein
LQSSTIIPSLSSSAFSAAVPSLTGGYKYRFTALRPFAFESACTRPQPRGRLDVEHHTSSSSSSSWPDTDRAPSFRRGYHRKTHAALKYCGAADVLSLLSLPPYSSTRQPIGITSFFPDPMHTHSRSRHRDFYGPRFYYYGLRHGGGASPASAPLGQAASSFHMPSLTSSAPLLTLLFLSSPLS